MRNDLIIQYSDLVLVFWDGNSRGTQYVINTCKKANKKVTVYIKKTVTKHIASNGNDLAQEEENYQQLPV